MAEQNIKQQFDYQDFVRNLAMQAESVVPVDIAPDDKKYVTNMVYNFCVLACEAVVKEENITHENALMITQFIGEWTFHKSIDLIRAGIAQQFRDSTLQQIAFVVFEISKQALMKGMPQDQVIQVVEHHVKRKYLEELTNLKDKNLISQQEFDKAMGESNIDKMAEEQEQEEIEEMPESKVMKLASFAMILQKMSNEKVASILSKMPEREAKLIMDYLQMDNLSSNADSTIMQYLSEIKAKVPISEKRKEQQSQNKIEKIVTNKNDKKINDIILNERDGIKKYISALQKNEEIQFPKHVSKVINLYLSEKVKV